MKPAFLILFACVCSLNGASVMSHHGRANFSFDDTITVAGKVTYFRWRNPHAYMEVQATKENNETETWVIEAGTPTALRKQGWEKDSIKMGDTVALVGNPDRDPDTKLLLLDHITRNDGETFYVAHRFRSKPPKKQTPASADLPVTPSQDFSGTWMRGPNNYLTDGYYVPPTNWPLTEQGEAQAARFNPLDNPSYDCLERGVPFFPIKNYNFLWTRYADRMVITQQQYAAIRTLHFNQDSHPDDLKPDLMGHSIARIKDDGSLVVDTVGFPAGVRWGLAPGVDSSEQKRVRERYTLDEDGLGITFSMTIEDPVYLTEPVTVNGSYYRVADIPFEPYVCDLEAARKGL